MFPPRLQAPSPGVQGTGRRVPSAVGDDPGVVLWAGSAEVIARVPTWQISGRCCFPATKSGMTHDGIENRARTLLQLDCKVTTRVGRHRLHMRPWSRQRPPG